ncbi:tRNA (N6-threonylcarbamoyladenosine(37)-N6)-methyltransferase TrmO [bacterium]|nr:tRNA (N6-threonylcarbamoyladenosine(37)-N6)-methyltransferase TrmO [bacterium]
MTAAEQTQIFTVRPIGFIRSPYAERKDMPRQPSDSDALPAELQVLPEFRAGLADLQEFDRIWVLAWLHQARPFSLRVTPPIDTAEHGVFATRSPDRPNPIALSCVRLQSVNEETGVLRVERMDLLDGTPVLDIKPYIPESDAFPDAASGWHGRARQKTKSNPSTPDRKQESSP